MPRRAELDKFTAMLIMTGNTIQRCEMISMKDLAGLGSSHCAALLYLGSGGRKENKERLGNCAKLDLFISITSSVYIAIVHGSKGFVLVCIIIISIFRLYTGIS
jgi:hypothetical protein